MKKRISSLIAFLLAALYSCAQTTWFSSATGSHYVSPVSGSTSEAGVRLSGGDFLVCEIGEGNRLKVNRYNSGCELVSSLKQPAGYTTLSHITAAELLQDESALIVGGTARFLMPSGFENDGFFIARVDLVTQEVRFLSRIPTYYTTSYVPVIRITPDRIYALYPQLAYPVVAAYDPDLNSLWSKGCSPAGVDSTFEYYEATSLALVHDTLVVSVNQTDHFDLFRLTSDGSSAGYDSYFASSIISIAGMLPAADGSLLLCGSEDYKPFVSKISAGGSPLWSRITDNPSFTITRFGALYEKPGGSLLALGVPYVSTSGDLNAYAQLDVNGNPLSMTILQGSGINYSFFNPHFYNEGFMAAGISYIWGSFTNNVLLFTPDDFSVACHKTPLAVTSLAGVTGTRMANPPSALNSWNAAPMTLLHTFTLAADSSEIPVFCNVLTSVANEEKANFSAYPNPVYRGENILMDFDHQGEYKISLLDLSGTSVCSRALTGSKGSLSMEGVSPGLYLLTVSEQNRVIASRKWVVR
jgi:hypothetical protein